MYTHTYTCMYVCVCTYIYISRRLSGKESACQCRRHRRLRVIPTSGRSPGEGNGSRLQYSCLEITMDRGSWWSQRVRHDGDCIHARTTIYKKESPQASTV